MPDPSPKLKHSGYIGSGQLGDPYTAHCCCSWEGQPRLTLDEAAADLAKHMKKVA